MSTERRVGEIKSWKGSFGFLIDGQNGRDVFVHISDLVDRSVLPTAGQKMEFVLGQDRGGRTCAQKVRSL
jgi:cold shock CspA family protein